MTQPYSTILGTRPAAYVNVDVDTDTPIFDTASILAAALPGDLFKYSLAAYHTGLASDGVTPATDNVALIVSGDDPALALMRITTDATQADPFILVDEPVGSPLIFRTESANGVRLRVQVTVSHAGSAR